MQYPLALIRLYLAQLWSHLSVVQQKSKPTASEAKTINRTYMATFVAFIFAAIYGIFGLQYESGHPLTFASLRSSRFIFWRHLFIRQVWSQMDIVIPAATLFSALILLDFALKQVDWQHQFTIHRVDGTVKLAGKAISTYESTKLLFMFHRAKLAYNIFGSVLYTFALLYCNTMVFLVTKIYFVSFGSLTFWVFGFPFILLFYILCIWANLTHIIVSGSCIQTRQQNLCMQFNRVMARLTQNQPLVRRLERIWPSYFICNRIVLSISQQLQEFSAFWSNYLTLIFLMYTVFQVLLAHIVFFGSSDSTTVMVAMKGLFIVGIFEMAILLFGLIQYCARVVKKNGQIGRLNRQFAVHCFQHQRLYRLSTRQLLKLELFQWPRLLHFYAFKVFGGSRITSKTFYAMTINITGFFLFIMKRIQ